MQHRSIERQRLCTRSEWCNRSVPALRGAPDDMLFSRRTRARFTTRNPTRRTTHNPNPDTQDDLVAVIAMMQEVNVPVYFDWQVLPPIPTSLTD